MLLVEKDATAEIFTDEDDSFFANKSALLPFSQLDKSKTQKSHPQKDFTKSSTQVSFTTKFDLATFNLIKNSFPFVFKITYPDEFFNNIYLKKYHSIIGLEKHDSKEVICFSHIDIDKRTKTSKIITLGVLKEYQGKKFGTQLLKKVIEELIMIGMNEVSLIVQNTNTVAINMYLKNDFMIEREMEGYYNLGSPEENKALMMKRTLYDKDKLNDSMAKIKFFNKKNNTWESFFNTSFA